MTTTTSLPYRIQFLGTELIRSMPFASLAERDRYLKSWTEVRGDLGRPAPAEGTDYELEDPR
jgi:hypothetical protein